MKIYPELLAGLAVYDARIRSAPVGVGRSRLLAERNLVDEALAVLQRAGYGGIENTVHDSDQLEP